MATLEHLVQRQIDALNQQDLDAVMALYAEDAVLHFPASAPISGKNAIRRAFERFFAEWEETLTLHAVVTAGTIAAAEGVVEGRHKTLHLKIPGRVAVRQRTYRHAFAVFWEFRDDKISRQRVYYDARELVRQLLGP